MPRAYVTARLPGQSLGSWARTAEVVALSAKGEAGLIRLGFTGFVPMLDMFPRLMRAFRDATPEIRIELRHMSTAQQRQALLNGELDIGILRPPYYFQAGPGLIAHRVWRDELAVFLRRTTRWPPRAARSVSGSSMGKFSSALHPTSAAACTTIS